MILPNIPVLLAAAVAVCLDFHAELSQKRKGICRRGWKTTTEFRPLVSEKLSFSVAKPSNDVKQSSWEFCEGVLRKILVDDIQSLRDHVEK